MKMNVLLSFVLAFLFGCAVGPSPEEIGYAYYGDYPTEYKEITTKYILGNLVDPDSAKFYEWVSPKKGWYVYRGETLFGYQACVFVNARNRMGGYTGQKLHYVMIKDGRVMVHDGGDYRHGSVGETMAFDLCRGRK